jgi:hypothetical protein
LSKRFYLFTKKISITIVQFLESFLPLKHVFSQVAPGFDNDISLFDFVDVFRPEFDRKKAKWAQNEEEKF